MKRLSLLSVFAVTLLNAELARTMAQAPPTRSATAAPGFKLGRVSSVPVDSAVIDPAATSWAMFVLVNRAADANPNFREWETWPSNADTFPPTGVVPGKWADVVKGAAVSRTFQPPSLSGSKSLFLGASGAMKSNPESYVNLLRTVREEVRRNRPAYNYITGNDPSGFPGVYNRAKIREWITSVQTKLKDQGKGRTSRRGPPITSLNFPRTSVEVKADWAPIRPHEKSGDYYTTAYTYPVTKDPATSGKAATMGLRGFHILSKGLKGWFWATWEHKDNPLLGKQFLQLKDTFGFPDGKLPSTDLKALFTTANVAHTADSPWLNYRLVSWQTLGTDGKILPPVSSNSIIEAPIYSKAGSSATKAIGGSSCIACHQRARTNGTIKGNGYQLPVSTSASNQTLEFDTNNGALSITFPLKSPLSPYVANTTPSHEPFPYDFDMVWSILLHAK